MSASSFGGLFKFLTKTYFITSPKVMFHGKGKDKRRRGQKLGTKTVLEYDESKVPVIVWK